MNLTGLSGRSMYAVDVFVAESRHNYIKNGSVLFDILKQMERTLVRDGYSISGSIRQGFECFKGTETVKIIVEKL